MIAIAAGGALVVLFFAACTLILAMERRASRRCLAAVVECAERTGTMHWLDHATLQQWVSHPGEIVARENHLSHLLTDDDRWHRFHALLPVYGLTREGDAVVPLRRWCGGWGGCVFIHPHTPMGPRLVEEGNSASIPAWMIGVPTLSLWSGQQIFVRIPSYPSLVVAHRR